MTKETLIGLKNCIDTTPHDHPSLFPFVPFSLHLISYQHLYAILKSGIKVLKRLKENYRCNVYYI